MDTKNYLRDYFVWCETLKKLTSSQRSQMKPPPRPWSYTRNLTVSLTHKAAMRNLPAYHEGKLPSSLSKKSTLLSRTISPIRSWTVASQCMFACRMGITLFDFSFFYNSSLSNWYQTEPGTCGTSSFSRPQSSHGIQQLCNAQLFGLCTDSPHL